MPIVDIEWVARTGESALPASAQALADALAREFGAGPARVWVRLRALAREAYAENDAIVAPGDEPVFVTVLHAQPPTGDALVREVRAVTATVAHLTARNAAHVHVQYAPAAAGRQAFGGVLVAGAGGDAKASS